MGDVRAYEWEDVAEAQSRAVIKLEIRHVVRERVVGVLQPRAIELYRALEILNQRAKYCVTVAAQAYHLRGAKAVGMKTVYVRKRWTGDVRGRSGGHQEGE